MKKVLKTLDDCCPRFYKICVGALFGIFFVGFFSPPPFQIDLNIIYAIAELGFFSLMSLIPYFLVKNGTVTIQKGDTTVIVDGDGDSNQDNNDNNNKE